MTSPRIPNQASDDGMHDAKLMAIVRAAIQASPDELLPFSDWMGLTLYHPAHGYYCRPDFAIGGRGDFITSPELGSLLANALSRQIEQLYQDHQQPVTLVELGPGHGTLMRDVIQACQQRAIPIDAVWLVEISPHLRARQQETLQSLAGNDRLPADSPPCHWVAKINELPTLSHAVVMANEWLDALPVELFRCEQQQQQQYYRGMVAFDGQQCQITWQPLANNDRLQQAIQTELTLLSRDVFSSEQSYQSEYPVHYQEALATIADKLHSGLLLLIDYGFDRHSYYHVDRYMGTLMCHYQHTSHPDPMLHIGRQDITAHVNFSLVADIASQRGLSLLGYTTQAHYLLDLGILDDLAQTQPSLALAQQLHTLLQPHEMGELFKVMALGVNLQQSEPLRGFRQRDFRYQL